MNAPKIIPIVIALGIGAAGLYTGWVKAIGSSPFIRFGPRVSAPDFPLDIAWINVNRPWSLDELRGKVVVLAFLTPACGRCRRSLKELADLGRKYPDELVIIGVQSPDTAAGGTRECSPRYGIALPLIDDRDGALADSYDIHAWPTLYLIDPEGDIAGPTSGEAIAQPRDRISGRMIRDFDADGLIDRTPVVFSPDRGRGRGGHPTYSS